MKGTRWVIFGLAVLCLAAGFVVHLIAHSGDPAFMSVLGRPKEPITYENKDLDQKDWEDLCAANSSVEDCPSAQNFYLRGTLLYQVRRRERAADDFVKAIVLDPAYRDKVHDFYHEDKHNRPVLWDADPSHFR